MRLTKLRTVYPGDEITEKGSTSLGIYNNKSFVCGTLCKTQNHLFVLSKTKRYYPYIDDTVIGRVIYVSAEYYKIDLDTYIGILPSLSFTNASKRNKPDIKKDDWLFCRIIKQGLEPVLSCVGEGFGKVEGYLFKMEVWQTQLLYVTTILFKIGKKYNYKISVGVNGNICIQSEDPKVARDVYEEILNEMSTFY
ncbi:hypothetical protein P3W45_000929 [Vairimorpha bombi]|jgi:exosome complex component RRP40